MLERLRLTDFKSFVDEEVALAPLTLLVGANASGKSNLLDALRFLREATTDRPFEEILDGDDVVRGAAREAARVGTSVFALQSTWRVPVPSDVSSPNEVQQNVQLVELTHRIACRTEPMPKLEAESLGRGPDEGTLFRTGAVRGDRIAVPWPSASFRKEQRPAPTYITRDVSVLWEIMGSINPGSAVAPAEVAEHAAALSAALQRIQWIAPQPSRMRGYGQRGRELGEDAKNISGVLAQLCQDRDEKRAVVEWLAEVCAPELVDLDFIQVPELGDVMSVFVEKGGKRISARSLSDGTLRFLGTLVALRTVEPWSVLLMEEIEADLHPTRIRLLVEYLQTVVRERNVQIIATTHSPVVLEWLDREALRSAILFSRSPEHEGTAMSRLGDLPAFDEIAQQKGIDELFTTGWLERAL